MKTLQKILRNNWHPFGYYWRQQRCLVWAWNVYLCITFYCFITTHFLCILLLLCPRVPVLGTQLLRGSCLHNWAIKLRLSSVTRGIWSHRTKCAAGFRESKGQRSRVTPWQNFMGSLENCPLLILLRVKPAWCKTAQQQPFQPIMLIYSSVLSGPNSIMVSIAGPWDNRCQSAMCETASARNLRFKWSKKNQPEAETTWITKSNLRGSRQRGRWQEMQCSVALLQQLFHTLMNICQTRL